MNRKIAITAVAVSLAAVYGTAHAASPSPLDTIAPPVTVAYALGISAQAEIIAPPLDIDPGIVKSLPETGARMPIIAPPDPLGGGRFGIRG